jgi:hypothetical protein
LQPSVEAAPGNDPLSGLVLDFLALDMANHSERLYSSDAGLVERLQQVNFDYFRFN